jgi:hypothetical protein
MVIAEINHSMDQVWLYEIRVEGDLPVDWSNWFEGMSISRGRLGESVLSGRLADQAALHGVLAKIRDLNLKLISVSRGDPAAERSRKE